ncbi:T9SS type A sorting domain-containing protein [Aureispira sp. CCB-E]|uniref:T9SS type A sorting domain-containing protein n=1 Tax=Aureispira sp. CCB-E TaxID=3051121 RepID=UPI002868BA9E|nr:T9SS type A sorting domain-containing protein [Aureispira sp. CCB-E]WMX12316.1 T9SS type A sorting domain-containing protein [Aureispira sp. CCB-E]
MSLFLGRQRVYFLLFSIVTSASLLQAQAPGGFSTNLGLWLKGDGLPLGANQTANWQDAHSTNDAQFHPNTVHYEVVEDINFNKSLHINDEWFDSPLDINVNDLNVFMVYRLRTNGNTPLWGNGVIPSQSSNNKGRQATSSSMTTGGTTDSPYTGADNTNRVYLNHINSIHNSNSLIFVNGASVATLPTTGAIVSTPTSGTDSTHQGIFIGKTDNTATTSGPGSDVLDVAEFIVYRGAVNPTQRNQINSYLAIKYGITITAHNYLSSTGTVLWDQGTNTGFDNDIVGIARDNGSGLNQTQSKSVNVGSLITISNSASNGEALLVGNNGGATGSAVTFQEGNSFLRKGMRINKIWKCQKTGAFNNFSINIDNGISLPSGFNTNNIFLLVSDNASFNSNLRAYPLLNFDASNVLLNDGDFFTIARSDAALWVKGDPTHNSISGSAINSYYDYVLGVNTMNSHALSGNLPLYTPNSANSAINFHPYATFNQGNHRNFLERDNFTGFGESGTSIFMVLRRDDQNTSTEAMMSYAVGNSTSQANEWLIDNPSDVEVFVEAGALSGGHEDNYDIEDNIPHIISNIRGNGNQDHLRVDADQDSENYHNNTVINSRGRLIFGQEQDDLSYTIGSFEANQEYEGDFAEAIVFNKRVSNNDRDAIESYLAIKYGITLSGDYKIYDGNTLATTWDQSSNNTYHRNIGGIGRDDAFNLDQRKSKSQNGSTSEVVIEHTGIFPNDMCHLIWGANNGTYDNITSSGAPSGYKLSQKRWKVQNYNNRIGLVTVTLPVPPSLIGQSLSDVRLIVSDNQNFNAGNISQYTGSVNNNEITFSNVSLSDDRYFALGFSENVGYINLDPGAPTTFEACPGSDVQFNYANLSDHPDRIEFRDTTGAALILNVSPTNTSGSGNTRNGTINLTIPTNAGTGNVRLLFNNTVVYNFNGNLVVHNPKLDFLPQTSPICATDTVPLIGFPSGGIFSVDTLYNVASYPNLIVNNTIIGDSAKWSNVNDNFKDILINYSYTPTYINGTPCLQSVNKKKWINIRDNRLDEVVFNYIIANPPSPNKVLELDSNTISNISPNLLDPNSNFNYPVSFSGTYVTFDSAANRYEFLTDQANSNNPVTIRYNNNGCIGEATGTIDVYPPLQIIGLLDTVCSEAAPFEFTRDTLSDYAYRRDTVLYSFSNITVLQFYEYNKITRVTTDISAYQNAIDTITTAPNNERYRFTPINIPLSADTVAMQMEYTTTITTIVTRSGNPPGSPTTRSYSFIAFDTIHMQDRPVPQILNLDSTYCPNASTVAIQTTPDFEYNARTYFEFRGDDAFGYNLLDTLQQDTLFDPSYHYDKHVPLKDRHLNVQLIYVVDRYGCVDKDTAYTRIVAPVQPIFYPQPAYCTSDFPTPLLPTFAPGSFTPFSVVATFLSRPGLDTVTQLFDPSVPGPGNHLATLQMIDNFGCRSEFTDTLFVRVPPQIKLQADNPHRTGFCSNEINVPLSTILLSGNPADTVVYLGAGVTGNTLDPSAIFPGSNGGTSPISVIYTDSFGCQGRDDVTLTIRPIPVLRLDSSIIGQRYCGNDPAFTIEGFVRDTSGNFQAENGSIRGDGVVLINGVYYYDPSTILVDSLHLDTVQYTFSDVYGCTNTISEVVRIDSVPEVSLTGLNLKYCIDDPIDQFVGLPDSNFQTSGTFYGGPGVNPNTGVFTPSQAGTGKKVVFYTFEDRNSCQSTAYDTTIVYGLPTPLFGGYQTQYCTAAAEDTLESFNLPLVGSSYYYFGGSIISDTALGIISPNRDSSGLKTIYYTFIDSVGCSNTDSVNIYIHPSPEIVVDGLDSAYCFNAPEDNISVFPSGVLVGSSSPGFTSSGNSIFFDPDQDTAGIKVFTYIYTDPNTTCADTLTSRTLVYKPQTPSYIGLDNFYCETRDTFPITGIPIGGVFSGQGIIGNGFSPAKAGGGLHTISYSVNDTLLYNADTLVCQVDTITNVRVSPLPVPTILSPGNNYRFCSADTSTILVSGTPFTWNTFKSNTGGVQYTITTAEDTLSHNPLTIRYYPDTTYYFDPSLVVEGTHFVTYIAMDSLTGCQDSIQYTYIVDDYTSPFFALDSVYCESADSVILFGVPSGGIFLRDNDTLRGAPPYFVPNPDYGVNNYANPVLDTIVYTVQDGACYGTDTQYVLINPVPQIYFTGNTPHNTYCLGMDSVPLAPNINGGVFTGNGVLFGTSSFIPDIAGPGYHPIYYDYEHPITGCKNQYIDTFSVFGMPNINFKAIGGCQLDSITFCPDNVILGLNNIFNNRIIDSITNITWEFEPNVAILGDHQNNAIDTISYVYSNPGVYNTKLLVTNQTYCTDTQVVRLVISPRVSHFPYDESFEASNGNWYAESRDSSHPLLWEWGIDSTNQGIASNRNNRFWSTQLNGTYSESEDAWVYSPCFDIDSLTRPMVKLDYWSDTRSADGAVLEYQKEDGSWVPLGETNRGINWFNSSIIIGQPGDQNLAPIGWSGRSNGWKDARYKLDHLGNRDNLRLRVAFGSPSVNLGGNFYDGFGFDNFWVGSRTRNVLLETTSNVNEPNMDIINDHVYQLIYNSPINKDLIMLQYHCAEPVANDRFYLDNEIVADARTYFYGIPEAGRAYIDGKTTGVPRSRYLQDIDFEKEMLASPKFDIEIDTFHHNNAGIFTIEATVKALVDLPNPVRYRINTVITEDSLTYGGASNSMVHAVVRKDDEAANIRTRSWAVGDTQKVTLTWNHGATSIVYRPEHFQAVVFIQAELSREVFQAATSRDVSGYWVGVDQIAAEPELNEINSMNLYPNPAKDYFNVSFDKALKQDYNWKLVGINGVEHQTGMVYAGDKDIQISNYDFPSGVYVFIVYNEHVFSQRKVIINQE